MGNSDRDKRKWANGLANTTGDSGGDQDRRSKLTILDNLRWLT